MAETTDPPRRAPGRKPLPNSKRRVRLVAYVLPETMALLERLGDDAGSIGQALDQLAQHAHPPEQQSALGY